MDLKEFKQEEDELEIKINHEDVQVVEKENKSFYNWDEPNYLCYPWVLFTSDYTTHNNIMLKKWSKRFKVIIFISNTLIISKH
jgi:hypothetical protein